MVTKRTLRKIALITGIILIFLWFGGNLGLYIYTKYIFPAKKRPILGNNSGAAFVVTPEKLNLAIPSMDAETLYLFQFKLSFPFYKEDIKSIYPSFSKREAQTLDGITINSYKNNKSRMIVFEKISPPENSELSFLERILLFKNYSYYGLQRMINYSRLKDYSWWNLPYNIRLTLLLTYKASLFFVQERTYDLETPYLRALLSEGKMNKNKDSDVLIANLIFESGRYSYSITITGDDKNRLRDILSTVQPVEDIEKGYKEMYDRYKNKVETSYPEELLRLSLVSLKEVAPK